MRQREMEDVSGCMNVCVSSREMEKQRWRQTKKKDKYWTVYSLLTPLYNHIFGC